MSADVIVKADIDLAKILEAIHNVGNTVASLTTTITDHRERLKDVEKKVQELDKEQVVLRAFEKQIKSLNTNVKDLIDDIEAVRRSQRDLTNTFSELRGKQDTNTFILKGSGKIVGFIASLILTALVTWWVSK